MVTDRTVLDGQLAETIAQMTSAQAKVRHVREQVRDAQRARNALQGDERLTGGGALIDALEDPSVRVIIVTVQTFLRAPEALDERARKSYAVILDEAHSGVGEKSDAAMARVFVGDTGDDYILGYATRRQHPNQSLFAFTATPRPETLFVYGTHAPTADAPERRLPFHRYRMKQAIAEGFILDVRGGYVRYDMYFRLRGVGMDGSDPEVDRRTATAAILREVSSEPKVMGTKVRVIAAHFLAKVRGALEGKARAMVVASSRDAAVRYHRALRAEFDARGAKDVGVLVAFSGAVSDPDTGVSVTERELNGFSEADLPRRFATRQHRVLVVANKYQTGFDQPLLCAMYIDRPLEGVQAVQTLSRLNRPHGTAQKPVFALDFVNDAEVLDAFARFFDGTSLTDAPTPEVLSALCARLDAAGVYTEGEVAEVAALALSPNIPLADRERQERIAGVVSIARGRFVELAPEAQEAFRSDLGEFLRLYGLLAQVVMAPDAVMEARATYGAWLFGVLPAAPGRPAGVDLSGRVVVEYARLVPVTRSGVSGGAGDVGGEDALPGEMVLRTRAGSHEVDPAVRLSVLLQNLNERYGFGSSPEDRASVETILAALLSDEDVVEAIRAAPDARDLAHDREIQRRVRRLFRERQGAGDAFAARFGEGDDELRRTLMELVLEMTARRAPKVITPEDGTLSAAQIVALAELNVLRNGVEPRLRAFVRRTLEGVHGARWFDEVLRCVPEAERRRLVDLDGDTVLRERVYLSTLVAVIDRHWTTAFGAVLESAPTQERLSRAQCIALLEVLNAHREDAHAKPVREVDLTTVRALVEHLHRVLDRVGE